MKRYFPGLLFIILAILFYLFQPDKLILPTSVKESVKENLGGIVPSHPLSIEALRNEKLTTGTLHIEEPLANGSNYEQYLAYYESQGNKIYGLLTVPLLEKPETGFPLIIFNHGYIPPHEYQTTIRYESYVDAFARNGYIVFKPDYRGHGNSEGVAVGGYGSNAYSIDVLNALETMKRYPDVDSNRIGMWGHSMGGHITLRSMVVRSDIDAGVIWAGVVGSYPDLVTNWRRGNTTGTPSPRPSGARRWRDQLQEQYGSFEKNPEFWNAISSTSYLGDISGPVQLHHGTLDDSVPYEFSEKLHTLLTEKNKISEYFPYEGDNHNISYNFATAMQRSINFFDRYVKNKVGR